MSGRRLYWAITGFVLDARGLRNSRRFASRMPAQDVDSDLENLILIILGCIGLICAVACYIVVGPNRDRRK